MIRLTNIYRGGKILQVDVDFLYVLLAERPPEANISHATMPSPDLHKQFVHRRPYEAWYVVRLQAQESREGVAGEIKFEDTPVGSVYLTKSREVGIFVLKAHQKRGIATLAIEELRRLHPGPLLANVSPGNEVSHQFFTKLGGRIIQTTYQL